MVDIITETPRLQLLAFTQENALFGFELWTDPQVMRYMGGPRDPERLQKFMEELLLDPTPQQFGFWTVVNRIINAPVGECGLIKKEVDGVDEIELVYLVAEKYWNKGYATEAAGALRDHGFNVMGLKRIVSLIDPENIASEKVAQKLGMRMERETIRPNGRTMLLYACSAGGS